jgi:hypothetical protein
MSSNLEICIKAISNYSTQGDLINLCQVCYGEDIFDDEIHHCYINLINHQIVCSNKVCALNFDSNESNWILFDINEYDRIIKLCHETIHKYLQKSILCAFAKTIQCEVCKSQFATQCYINISNSQLLCPNLTCALKVDSNKSNWILFNINDYYEYRKLLAKFGSQYLS